MSQPNVNFAAIPHELKILSRWVNWRFGPARPDGKRPKIPIMPNGKPAKVNDPTTWSSFEAVQMAFLNPFCFCDGIGFVLTSQDGLIGIDFDDCVSDNGSIAPWAQRIVNELRTCWEFSPSGSGLRAFLRGSLPQAYGNGAKHNLVGGGRIEVYQDLHFLTVTGLHLPGTPTTIEPLQGQLEAFLARELPRNSTGGGPMNDHPFSPAYSPSYRLGDLARHPPVDATFADNMALIERLRRERGQPFCSLFDDGNIDAYGGDESAGDFALAKDLARACALDPQRTDWLFRLSALYPRPERAKKWDEVHSGDGRTYGEMTIQAAIESLRNETSIGLPFLAPPPWKIQTARAIVERGVLPAQFDIDQLLPMEDGPAVLFGPPGSLKSWLGLHACGCFATEKPFLGRFPVRGRPYSIYINLDAGDRAFERRVVRSGFSVDNLLIVSVDAYDLGMLRQLLQAYPGAFVVIDTFSDAYKIGRGEDQAQVMRRFLREHRGLYQEFGCNGFLIDHPHRPRDGAAHGDYYGSIQKEAAARIMWQVTPLRSAQGISRAKVACRKMSECELFKTFEFSVDFRDSLVRCEFQGYLDEATGVRSEGPSDGDRIAALLCDVQAGMTSKGITERTGLPRDRVRDAIKDGRFHLTGKGRATRYLLGESTECRAIFRAIR